MGIYSPVPSVDVKDPKRGNVEDAVWKVDCARHDELITNNLEDILSLMAQTQDHLNDSFGSCQTP